MEAASRNQLFVLVILDTPNQQHSVIQTQSARYIDGKLTFVRYLDDYPFPYYVIVSRAEELPDILSDALRQWFELTAASSM